MKTTTIYTFEELALVCRYPISEVGGSTADSIGDLLDRHRREAERIARITSEAAVSKVEEGLR